MNGLWRRPLALAAGVFLLTLFLFARTGAMGGTLPALLLGGIALLIAFSAILVGIFCSNHRPRLQTVLFYGAAMFFAISLSLFTAWRIDPLHASRLLLPYENEPINATVTVEEIDYRTEYSTAFIGSLQTVDGNTTSLRGRISLPYSTDLRTGDTIRLSFVLRLLRSNGKLSDCYDLSQGLSFEADAFEEAYTLLSQDEQHRTARYAQLRLTLRRQLYPYLSDEDIGLASALLLGDKSSLSPLLQTQFRNLGISHTLAVSGLHLGILFCSLLWLFRKLTLPRWLHLPILFPLLLFYCALVGSPSVLRAGGMLLFLFAAYPLGRLRDSITSLFVTITAICLISPYSILDIGLLLSFFATWGILLIVPVCAEKFRTLPAIPRAFLNTLVVTLSATLFTLPFTIWYFGSWAMLSVIANLLLVPILTVLLYLLPILFLLSPIPCLAYTPATGIRLIGQFIRETAGLFGSDDRLLLPLQYSIIEWAALLLIAGGIVLCLFRKTRPLTLAVLLVFLSFSGGYDYFHAKQLLHTATILPLSDGKNDCLLLQDGTRVLLIDRSEGGYGFLSDAIAQGEQDPLIRVDSILLTHYHYRQISSLTHLLDSGRIEYLILPQPTPAEQDTARILTQRAEAKGCKVEMYSMELSCIGYHGYEIQLDYYPDNAFRSITIRYGEEQLLYTEDLDQSSSPGELPAHYQNDPDTVDEAWNQLYRFPSSSAN